MQCFQIKIYRSVSNTFIDELIVSKYIAESINNAARRFGHEAFVSCIQNCTI